MDSIIVSSTPPEDNDPNSKNAGNPFGYFAQSALNGLTGLAKGALVGTVNIGTELAKGALIGTVNIGTYAYTSLKEKKELTSDQKKAIAVLDPHEILPQLIDILAQNCLSGTESVLGEYAQNSSKDFLVNQLHLLSYFACLGFSSYHPTKDSKNFGNNYFFACAHTVFSKFTKLLSDPVVKNNLITYKNLSLEAHLIKHHYIVECNQYKKLSLEFDSTNQLFERHQKEKVLLEIQLQNKSLERQQIMEGIENIADITPQLDKIQKEIAEIKTEIAAVEIKITEILKKINAAKNNLYEAAEKRGETEKKIAGIGQKSTDLRLFFSELIKDIVEKVLEELSVDQKSAPGMLIFGYTYKYLFDLFDSIYLRALPDPNQRKKIEPLNDRQNWPADFENDDELFRSSLSDSSLDDNTYLTAESDSESEAPDSCPSSPVRKSRENALVIVTKTESDEMESESKVYASDLPKFYEKLWALSKIIVEKVLKDTNGKYNHQAVQSIRNALSESGIINLTSEEGLGFWIKSLLNGVCENELFKQVHEDFALCMAERFVNVLENLALRSPAEGYDFFQSALREAILTFTDKQSLDSLEDARKEYKEYTTWKILYEACEHRDNYIKKIHPMLSKDCLSYAAKLTEEHIALIFQENGYNEILLTSLVAAIKEKTQDLSLEIYTTPTITLHLFFKYADGNIAKENLKKTFARGAGPLAIKLLKTTGLDQDATLGFSQFIDLKVFREESFPQLLYETYCSYTDSETRPWQIAQDWAIKKFIENLPTLMSSNRANTDQMTALLSNVPFIKDLKIDETTLSQFSPELTALGWAWFYVVNNMIKDFPWAGDENKKKLAVLDPESQLKPLCQSITHTFLPKAKKKIYPAIIKYFDTSPELKDVDRKPTRDLFDAGYNVVENHQQIEQFIQLYLSGLIEKIFANLACQCPEGEPGALFANILNTIVRVIETAGDEKAVDEMTLDLLATAGFKQPSDLCFLALPFGNGKVEKIIWDQIVENLPAIIHDFYLALAYRSQMEQTLKEGVEKIEGYEALKSDTTFLSQNILFKLCEMIAKDPHNISYTLKDTLDENGIKVNNVLLLEAFMRHDSISKQSNKSLTDFLQNLLTPRLLGAFEHAATYNPQNTQGNILERVLVNAINVVRQSLSTQDLSADVKRYDFYSPLLEAYQWRDRYLKETQNADPSDCDKVAGNITEDDVIAIFAMGGYDSKKIHTLLKAIGGDRILNSEASNNLLTFFREPSQGLKKTRKNHLTKGVFGKTAAEILKMVGLHTDEDLSSYETLDEFILDSLPLITEQVSEILLNLYREMSDVEGQHAKNMELFQEFFGHDQKLMAFILKAISRAAADFAQDYVKKHPKELATTVCTLFPKVKLKQVELLSNTLFGMASTSKEETPNALALEGLLTFMQERVFMSWIHFLVAKIESDGEEQLEDPVVEGEMRSWLTDFMTPKKPTQQKSATRPENVIQPEEPEGFLAAFQRSYYGTLTQITPSSSVVIEPIETKTPVKRVTKTWFIKVLETGALIFEKHMAEIQKGMEDYWKLDHVAKEANWTPEELAKKKEERLTGIFQPLCDEAISWTSLNSKNLKLPLFCQDELWKTITSSILPATFAQYYLMLTEWKETKTEKIKEVTNLISYGAGAAKGLAFYTLHMVESSLAINGNGMGDNLFEILIDFLANRTLENQDSLSGDTAESLVTNLDDLLAAKLAKKNKKADSEKNKEPLEAPIIAPVKSNKGKDPLPDNPPVAPVKKPKEKVGVSSNKIEKRKGAAIPIPQKTEKGKQVAQSLNDVVMDGFRSGQLSPFIFALNTFAEGMFFGALGGIASSLAKIDALPNNGRAKVLSNMAKELILGVGNHFKKLHAIAVSENKAHAYELKNSRSKLLKGISIAPSIAEFYFLRDQMDKAAAGLDQAEKALGSIWNFTEESDIARKNTYKLAREAFDKTQIALNKHVINTWADQGQAIADYVEKEQLFIEAQEKASSLSNRWFQWWDEEAFSAELASAVDASDKSEKDFHAAEEPLKAAAKNNFEHSAPIEKKKLINICSQPKYREMHAELEKAEALLASYKQTTDSEKIKRQSEVVESIKAEIEAYRINEYFTYLGAKIWFLIKDHMDAFFPEDFPPELKKSFCKTFRTKLPSILNSLFHFFAQQENFQGIVLGMVKKMNAAIDEKNKNRSSAIESIEKNNVDDADEDDMNDDLNERCSQVIVDWMSMLSKEVLDILNLSQMKDGIQDGGGKELAKLIRNFLADNQCLTMFNSQLKDITSNLLPNGQWHGDDFIPSEIKLPKTPEDQQQFEKAYAVKAQQVGVDLENEIDKFLNNQIAQPFLKDFENKQYDGIEGFFEWMYDGLVAFTNLIAYWIFKPIANYFVGSIPRDVRESVALEPENLLFIAANIFLETLVDIDEKIESEGENSSDAL